MERSNENQGRRSPLIQGFSAVPTERPLQKSVVHPIEMQGPKVGDVILRGSPRAGFVLLDAATEDRIAGPAQFSRAVQLALALGAIAIWRELLDQTGNAIGPPVQIAKGHAASR